MIGPPVRPAFLLAVLLTSLAVAQEPAASRTADPGPIVDPAIVGTWTGSLHLVVLVRFDIGALGQLTISFDGAPSAYLLEANNGRWVAEPIGGGEQLSGTYEILREGRLGWGGAWAISWLERDREIGTTSRPKMTASELDQLDSLPNLLSALQDPEPAHRSVAALRLAWVASNRPNESASAVRSLTAHLEDESAEVRWHCVAGLRTAGADARTAGTKLIELLHDADTRVRYGAVRALRPVVGDAMLVVPALATALADSEYAVSNRAGFELGEMGTQAAPAAEALAKALTAYPHRTNYGAKFALLNLGSAEAAVAGPIIAKALRRDRLNLMSDEDLLKWAGPFAKDAVPALIEAVERASLGDRGAAVRILAAIGPQARSALPVLNALADNPKETRWLREAAKNAATRIATTDESRPNK